MQFNSTDKYQSELEFLAGIVGHTNELLDYGCGIGTAIKYFASLNGSIVRGYDVNQYFDPLPSWMLDAEPKSQYDDITFIHSLAHIKRPEILLHKLKLNLKTKGRITVITPNLDWINLVGNTNSDDTVVRHFTSDTLSKLFRSAGYQVLKSGQFGEVKGNQHERLFIQCQRNSI